MRGIGRALVMAALLIGGRAEAVIVGDPNGSPADSPANHVDPNVTTSPYGGVVGINVAGIGPASGVLLRTNDPNHSYVLTAAHIVDPNRNGSLAPLANVSVHVNYNGNNSTVLGASSLTVNSNWYTGSDRFYDDLLIIKLNGVVPAGVPTYRLYRPLTIIGQPAKVITIVGYGQTGDGVNGATAGTEGVNIKRVGANVAEFINTDDEGSGVFEVFQFDFDAPANTGSGGSLGNATEVQFGIGDSGSPAFVNESGELFIYGINTAGFNGSGAAQAFPKFGSFGGGQIVSAYQGFIDANVPEPTGISLAALAAFGLLFRRSRAR